MRFSSPYPSAPASRAAFTLIELLVVIAIIGLLAAILFPVFARARDNARRATCQANLRNLGLAFAQYAQDFDEQLPMAYNHTGINGYVAGTWTGEIEVYVGTLAHAVNYVRPQPLLYRCPNDTVAPASSIETRRSYAIALSDQRAIGVTSGPNGVYTGRYAAGEHVALVPNTLNYARGRKLSEFPSVADTILLTENPESGNYLNNTIQGYVRSPTGQATDVDTGTVYAPLHFGGWNYLFVDGHVKWLLPEATIGTGSLDNPNGMWSIADGD